MIKSYKKCIGTRGRHNNSVITCHKAKGVVSGGGGTVAHVPGHVFVGPPGDGVRPTHPHPPPHPPSDSVMACHAQVQWWHPAPCCSLQLISAQISGKNTTIHNHNNSIRNQQYFRVQLPNFDQRKIYILVYQHQNNIHL